MAEPVSYGLNDLLVLMARLRDPDNGCPWDREQTMATVVPHTLEECYELAAAIADDDSEHIREELGDVLFQVVFYSHIAEEQAAFTMAEVIDGLVRKLLRRHPHVFADGQLYGAVADAATPVAAVKQRWESIKQQERQDRAHHSLMDDVPLALPALSRAQKLQKRAARVTFDWYHPSQVLDKLVEELQELQHALAQQSPEQVLDEAGDVLFSVVNYLRHLNVDAETALRQGNRKFEGRFRQMEQLAEAAGQNLAELGPEQLEALWQRAKKLA